MANIYPYSQGSRLLWSQLNKDFELSAGVVPPGGGGAGQFKLWMDTSVNPQPALRIVTAARATAGVYVPSEWGILGRLDLNTRQFQYQGTWGGDLTVSGNIAGASLFLNGSIFFNGVTFASSDGTTSHIFDGTGGNAIHLQAAANFYDADVHYFRDNIGATQNLVITNAGITLNGNYIHFVGSSGFVNSTGGPMLFADQSNHVYKQGSGNGSWMFQTYAGAVVANLNSAGTLFLTGALVAVSASVTDTINAASISVSGQVAGATVNASSIINAVQYNLSGGPFAVNNGTATVIYDNTGAPAIHLWPTITYYDADLHSFRNNGAGSILSIDSGGSVSAAGYIASLGYQTRAGIAGAATGNHFNIEWQALGHLWIDNVDQGWFILDTGSGISTSLLRGGNGNDSGVIRTAPTADSARHSIAFGWDSTDPTLYEIIDNSFTAVIPWSETIKSLKIQADGGAPAGWHLAVFTGGLINYIYSDVASDARLKQGIADSEVDALAALCAVPVRRYEWLDEVQKTFGVRQPPVECGLVAQELLHLPGVVGVSPPRGDPYPEDTHTIMHDRIHAYTIRAIQQLAARVEALEASA